MADDPTGPDPAAWIDRIIVVNEGSSFPADKKATIDRALRLLQATLNRTLKFKVSDPVTKVGGGYEFDGIVVSAFFSLSAADLFVIEDARGNLHIYGPQNLILTSDKK